MLAGSDNRACTRNGINWSDRYRFVLKDAARLDCSSAIIDGEIIIQDKQDRSDFDNLRLAIERTPHKLIFYAFDLLHIDGEDLRKQTVIDRRERLRDFVGPADPECRIHFSEHVVGGGPEFFDGACGAELEGIVSKRTTSCYAAAVTIFETKPCLVEDLSPRGARATGRNLPGIGSQILLRADRVEALGRVRWCDGDKRGNSFR